MRTLALLALVFVTLGCAERPEPLAEPPSGEQPSSPGEPPQGGGTAGIGIVSPAAGTSSPVTNSDSVAGAGGGGVNAAAKGQAHKAAENMGGGSLNQLDDN